MPTACAAKANAAGKMFTAGAGEVPMPVRETDCTAPVTFPELSVMLRLALNVPAVDGIKEMRSAQLSLAASIDVGGHPFAIRN